MTSYLISSESPDNAAYTQTPRLLKTLVAPLFLDAVLPACVRYDYVARLLGFTVFLLVLGTTAANQLDTSAPVFQSRAGAS